MERDVTPMAPFRLLLQRINRRLDASIERVMAEEDQIKCSFHAGRVNAFDKVYDDLEAAIKEAESTYKAGCRNS